MSLATDIAAIIDDIVNDPNGIRQPGDITPLDSRELEAFITYISETLRLPGTSNGQLAYYNGSAWVVIAPGTNGQVLTMVAGVPTWV